jgi:hypothetical protein
MRYNELIKRYKYEIALIIIVIVISCIVIRITENMNGDQDLTNYFWMPSSIMQSVAAIYALFIAVFVLSIQNNQQIISLLGDLLKPSFKVVSAVVATTIYFNGLVLFIFSHYKPIEFEVNILYFGSLISLLVSLIAIVYFSFWMISKVAGINTQKETLYNLTQGENIKECYLLVKTCYNTSDRQFNSFEWSLKSDNEKKIIIEISKSLLEYGTPFFKLEMADFLGSIKETSAVGQLIKNLDDNNSGVGASSASALGIIGDVRAVEPLIKKLDDDDSHVRRSSAEALGRLGDVRAVEPLIRKLKDYDSNVRSNSVEALGRIRDERAIDPLIECLDDLSKEVISSSAYVLGMIGNSKAVEPLINILDDPNDRVGQTSAQALGKIGDERAIEPLTKRLKDDNAFVRRFSKEAIDAIEKRMAK